MKSFKRHFPLPDDAATQALGARLAPYLRVGDVICLSGELGAGKTTFSRGLIQAISHADEVPSPTYTLVQTYETPDYDIWHFDLYRLASPQDVWALGIEDALYDGVCLIEWPSKLEELKPEGTLDIEIIFKNEASKEGQEEGRELIMSAPNTPVNWEERLKNV